VARTFALLASTNENSGDITKVQTDRKMTYGSILREAFGRAVVHERFDSKRARDYSNPLFPINHTLAMMRDGVSRLVRRTWAASKRSECLRLHMWIWLVWRNYVRGITVKAAKTTPAMAIGIDESPWERVRLFRWRHPFLDLDRVH